MSVTDEDVIDFQGFRNSDDNSVIENIRHAFSHSDVSISDHYLTMENKMGGRKASVESKAFVLQSVELIQGVLSKEDYDALLKRNEELEAELKELKMQTSATKINEDFNTFMEAIENNNRAIEGAMRQLLALAR